MKWCEIVLTPKTAFHIGSLNWGVVNETMIFIPGWTVWGALVNAYINSFGTDNEKVENIKEEFKKITNFYPMIDGEKLYPRYENGKFTYTYVSKDLRIDEGTFRYLFVHADFKTSLYPILRSAKEEHLYEFEYVLPKPIKGRQYDSGVLEELKKGIKWVGYIYIDDNYIEKLKSLKELFIGGDVKYGYGIFEMDIEETKETQEQILFEKEDSHNDICITKQFIKFEKASTYYEFISGKIGILIELNFEKNTPEVYNAGYYAFPGSKIKIKNSCDNIHRILQKGKLIFPEGGGKDGTDG